jgi:hypothetical protein
MLFSSLHGVLRRFLKSIAINISLLDCVISFSFSENRTRLGINVAFSLSSVTTFPVAGGFVVVPVFDVGRNELVTTVLDTVIGLVVVNVATVVLVVCVIFDVGVVLIFVGATGVGRAATAVCILVGFVVFICGGFTVDSISFSIVVGAAVVVMKYVVVTVVGLAMVRGGVVSAVSFDSFINGGFSLLNVIIVIVVLIRLGGLGFLLSGCLFGCLPGGFTSLLIGFLITSAISRCIGLI